MPPMSTRQQVVVEPERQLFRRHAEMRGQPLAHAARVVDLRGQAVDGLVPESPLDSLFMRNLHAAIPATLGDGACCAGELVRLEPGQIE